MTFSVAMNTKHPVQMLPMKKATFTSSLSHSYSFRDDHNVNLRYYKTRLQAIFRLGATLSFEQQTSNQTTMHDHKTASKKRVLKSTFQQ